MNSSQTGGCAAPRSAKRIGKVCDVGVTQSTSRRRGSPHQLGSECGSPDEGVPGRMPGPPAHSDPPNLIAPGNGATGRAAGPGAHQVGGAAGLSRRPPPAHLAIRSTPHAHCQVATPSEGNACQWTALQAHRPGAGTWDARAWARRAARQDRAQKACCARPCRGRGWQGSGRAARESYSSMPKCCASTAASSACPSTRRSSTGALSPSLHTLQCIRADRGKARLSQCPHRIPTAQAGRPPACTPAA